MHSSIAVRSPLRSSPQSRDRLVWRRGSCATLPRFIFWRCLLLLDLAREAEPQHLAPQLPAALRPPRIQQLGPKAACRRWRRGPPPKAPMQPSCLPRLSRSPAHVPLLPSPLLRVAAVARLRRPWLVPSPSARGSLSAVSGGWLRRMSPLAGALAVSAASAAGPLHAGLRSWRALPRRALLRPTLHVSMPDACALERQPHAPERAARAHPAM